MKRHLHSTSHSSTPPTPDFEPWVNTTAACRHLGISTPTGEYRFRRSELDNLLD